MKSVTEFLKKELYGGKAMKGKRIAASVLTGALLISTGAPASAASQETDIPKQEVVYVHLGSDGSVSEIYVVNIFDLDTDGQIIDYGEYQSLRNMTTTNEIHYADGAATIDAGAGKLYYEGKLDSDVIPWNISIHYYMDGTEYTGEEIAGMSGAFRMTVDITENTSCTGSFFDGYALQISVTLDTNQCENISAPDATIANVGGSKQLTYTILPGKGAEIEVTADVTDFEMEGLSINGLPLNLNIEIDDEELLERVAELLEAIETLDDGAGELYDGAAQLQDRVQTDLRDGVSELQDGAYQLHDGTADLRDGGASLESGAAELQSGAEALDAGVQSLNDGISRIQDALNALNAQSDALTGGSAEFKAALGQLQSALDGISVTAEDLSALTAASSSIKSGVDELVSGIAALQQNVSFAAYKTAMGQNGLDIDALKQNNEAAASSLSVFIAGLQNQIAALREAGQDTSALESQAEQLSSVVLLLQANNAGISGTERYLTSVSQNLEALLDGAKTLQENYAMFDLKIAELAETLGNLSYQMSSMASAVNGLVAAYEELDNGLTSYTDAVAQIAAGYTQISDGAAQLVTGSGSLVSGTQNLYDGTSELLAGITEVYDGTGTLCDGTEELDDGVTELLEGIAELYDGTGELKDGTSAFREETEGMDTEISDQIDNLLEEIIGGGTETVSFVSEKNTNIDSVQFVIQTSSVEIAEESAADPEPAKPLSFWQKLLKLFGLYHEN